MTLSKSWARELMKPVVWEVLADVPHQPLLLNCFRRASSYCYREIDVPSPYVTGCVRVNGVSVQATVY